MYAQSYRRTADEQHQCDEAEPRRHGAKRCSCRDMKRKAALSRTVEGGKRESSALEYRPESLFSRVLTKSPEAWLRETGCSARASAAVRQYTGRTLCE